MSRQHQQQQQRRQQQQEQKQEAELKVLRQTLASRKKTLAKKRELLSDLLWNIVPKLEGNGSLREVGNLRVLDDGEVAQRAGGDGQVIDSAELLSPKRHQISKARSSNAHVYREGIRNGRASKRSGHQATPRRLPDTHRELDAEESPWASVELHWAVGRRVPVCCYDIAFASRRAWQLNTVLRVDKEISMLKELSHEHISEFVDAYRHAGGLRLVTNVATLDSLETLLMARASALERPAASEEAAFNRRVLKQLFGAVAHCHYHFICHRSIHSRSVLIVDGQVKLSNFGSAQVIDSGSKGRLRGVFGRRGYAAPEMYVGAYDGFKADMWSLGAVVLDVYCGFVSASRLEASAIPFEEPGTPTSNALPHGQAVLGGSRSLGNGNMGTESGGERRFDNNGTPAKSYPTDGSSPSTTLALRARGDSVDPSGSESCIGDFYVVVQGGFSSPPQSTSKATAGSPRAVKLQPIGSPRPAISSKSFQAQEPQQSLAHNCGSYHSPVNLLSCTTASNLKRGHLDTAVFSSPSFCQMVPGAEQGLLRALLDPVPSQRPKAKAVLDRGVHFTRHAHSKNSPRPALPPKANSYHDDASPSPSASRWNRPVSAAHGSNGETARKHSSGSRRSRRRSGSEPAPLHSSTWSNGANQARNTGSSGASTSPTGHTGGGRTVSATDQARRAEVGRLMMMSPALKKFSPLLTGNVNAGGGSTLPSASSRASRKHFQRSTAKPWHNSGSGTGKQRSNSRTGGGSRKSTKQRRGRASSSLYPTDDRSGHHDAAAKSTGTHSSGVLSRTPRGAQRSLEKSARERADASTMSRHQQQQRPDVRGQHTPRTTSGTGVCASSTTGGHGGRSGNPIPGGENWRQTQRRILDDTLSTVRDDGTLLSERRVQSSQPGPRKSLSEALNGHSADAHPDGDRAAITRSSATQSSPAEARAAAEAARQAAAAAGVRSTRSSQESRRRLSSFDEVVRDGT